MAANEIATMRKITQVIDANKARSPKEKFSYEATPRLTEFGLINLLNFSKQIEEKINVYFIMPLYDMNLQEYLFVLKGIQKMEKIMDVAAKIVDIFKFIHLNFHSS